MPLHREPRAGSTRGWRCRQAACQLSPHLRRHAQQHLLVLRRAGAQPRQQCGQLRWSQVRGSEGVLSTEGAIGCRARLSLIAHRLEPPTLACVASWSGSWLATWHGLQGSPRRICSQQGPCAGPRPGPSPGRPGQAQPQPACSKRSAGCARATACSMYTTAKLRAMGPVTGAARQRARNAGPGRKARGAAILKPVMRPCRGEKLGAAPDGPWTRSTGRPCSQAHAGGSLSVPLLTVVPSPTCVQRRKLWQRQADCGRRTRPLVHV